MTGSSSTALSFQLPPHRLDLLQHFLVGHQALPYQHASEGLLLLEAGAEEFLKGGYLPWIKFLGHGYVTSSISGPIPPCQKCYICS